MKFYKITCGENVEYGKLYSVLENIGDFIIDKQFIIFYLNNKKKNMFSGLNVSVEEIDPLQYKTGNIIADSWITENYRKFRVEKLLKDAEIEKQEDLKNLYNVIKAADEIIERKEDLVDEE